MRKMYIAVHDEVEDHMVPTLVAHSIINAHLYMQDHEYYRDWLKNSYRKVVVKVNNKEFNKIAGMEKEFVWLGHENTQRNAEPSCAVLMPVTDDERPNVLKFAKMWKPRQ